MCDSLIISVHFVSVWTYCVALGICQMRLLLQPYSTECVYTQSHAYIVKIPTTYYEASNTIFRLFWDAESWNFSNKKTCDAFRTLLLLPVSAPFFKVSIVKNQRFDSLANSQLVPSDFQLSKALSNLGLMCKKFKTWGTNCELDPEPIFWNFPNENWEICEKQSKTGKSRTFKNHPFGIKTFKYGPHTF